MDPVRRAGGGPNFYAWGDGVRYDVNIDNDHDAKPDDVPVGLLEPVPEPEHVPLQHRPGHVAERPDLNFYQTYDLTRIDRDNGKKRTLVDDATSAPSNVGAASMPNYNSGLFDAATEEFGAAPSKTWGGQSDDAFFLDLRVFDLLYGADLSEVGDDTLAGFNVNTLALQVPKTDLASGGTRTRTRSSASGARHLARARRSRRPTDRRRPTANSFRSRAWACHW